jgi:hypothetical protein
MEARKHLHPGQHNRFKGGWLAVKKITVYRWWGRLFFAPKIKH